MKKTIFFLALVLAASAAVWAQTVSDLDSASDFLIDWNFNAVQTESIESRFSVQRFTSDVDDYIDPALFNPQIGTFMFLGGHKNDNIPFAVSLGAGKTVGSAYLGVYYGGLLVNSSGNKTENGSDKIATTSNGSWNNNLAVLFGVAGMGFRLDFIMNDNLSKTTHDGTLTSKETEGKTSIALGWGAVIGDLNLAPWARIGFKFPKVETTTDNPAAPTQRMTDTRDAQLGLQAGALYRLSDADSLVGELNFTTQFAREYKGDTKYFMGSAVGALDGPDPYKEGGGWGANLSAYYQKDIGFGKIPGLRLRLKPRLEADFASWSKSSTKAGEPELPTANWFSLGAGLDAGAEYRFEKIGLYTGFCLDIIEWKTLGFSGGDDANKTKDSAWKVTGLTWKDNHNDNATIQNPILKFGVTFAPIEGMVIGAGLEAAVAQIFNLNLRTMEISNITNTSANDRTSGMFGTNFVITVSCKF